MNLQTKNPQTAATEKGLCFHALESTSYFNTLASFEGSTLAGALLLNFVSGVA